MNTIGEIGRADEELWNISVEDSLKRRQSVSWKVEPHTRVSETCQQGQEHELMIDSGCYGACLRTLVCTAISFGGLYQRRSSDCEQRDTTTLWTDSGVWTRDDEQWQTNSDTDQF